MVPVSRIRVERNLSRTGSKEIAVFPKKSAGFKGLEENLRRYDWGY
jgi:hypothetical protein